MPARQRPVIRVRHVPHPANDDTPALVIAAELRGQ